MIYLFTVTMRLSMGMFCFCCKDAAYLNGICVATRSAQNMKKAKTKKQTW